MKIPSVVIFFAVVAGCLAGCQSAADAGAESAIVFAREDAGGRSYHVQSLAAGQAPVALTVPPGSGNLQTAARAGLAAATVGGAATGTAELRLLSLTADAAGDRALVGEWAWDFALRGDGGAIAWVAGRERRQLWVARAPAWKPAVVSLPPGATPGEPRWLEAQRLLVVLRSAGRSELVTVDPDSGATRPVYRTAGEAMLSDAVAVAGSVDVLVVESRDAGTPGRLLRVASGGGEPRVLATGFFVPGTLTVSPDGRFIAVVWSAELAAVQRREAALQWIGEAWRGAPASMPGVTSLAWDAAGTRLAVARQREGRRWIEVYAAEAAGTPPRVIGYEGAACVAPQWWQPRR